MNRRDRADLPIVVARYDGMISVPKEAASRIYKNRLEIRLGKAEGQAKMMKRMIGEAYQATLTYGPRGAGTMHDIIEMEKHLDKLEADAELTRTLIQQRDAQDILTAAE